MSEVVTSQPITVECVSPVHIGSGDRLGQLDFIREAGRVIVVDQEKFLRRVEATPALSDAYVRFCETDRPILADFMRSNRIAPSEFTAYTMRADGSVGREILTFIKAPKEGPYLPGSSLKGAVRSALLHRVVREQDEVRQAIAAEAMREAAGIRQPPGGRMSAKLRKASAIADRVVFGEDHNRDVMRMFQLADSRPIFPSDLVIAEVRVLTVQSDGLGVKETRTGNPMRLTVEMLPADTQLESRLTWNGYLGEGQGPSAALGFGERVPLVSAWVVHCNAVARDALGREAAFYRQFGEAALVRWHEGLLNRLDNLKANQCLLHLGWGAGFDAMAITNLFPPEERRRIRHGANLGKIGSDGPVEPFPKSRKVVWHDEKRVEPLGWILLTVGEKPVEGTRRPIAVPSGERIPAPEPRPQPEPRPRAGRPPEPPPRARPSSKADLEALRRSVERSKGGGRAPEGKTKASEKAKQEQEKIRRRYRGEEP